MIAVVDDNGALSTMDDGGGSRIDYPVPGVTFGFPAWSPDGTQIAVVGDSANDETEIYVFTVPRGDATDPGPVVIYRSSTHPAFYLYWTPDGRSVAFLATEANEISLRIAPADGGAPLDGSGPGGLIRTGAPLYYDWIDNERLLVHVGTGSAAFTGEIGLNGKPLKATLPGTGNFRSPSRSPDGRYQAYVRSKTDASGQLVVSARDGSTSHELPVFGPTAFVFNPAGDSLATVAALSAADPNLGVPIGPLRLIDPATRQGPDAERAVGGRVLLVARRQDDRDHEPARTRRPGHGRRRRRPRARRRARSLRPGVSPRPRDRPSGSSSSTSRRAPPDRDAPSTWPTTSSASCCPTSTSTP